MSGPREIIQGMIERLSNDVTLSPADANYVSVHRPAAVRASEYASGLLASAERDYTEDEWEVAAQAEEAAYDHQAQAEEELARADARVQRAMDEQAAYLEKTSHLARDRP